MTRKHATAVAVLLGLLAGTLYGFFVLYYAPGPLTEPRDVVIEKGSGTREIAHTLAEAGAVDSEGLFYVYAAWGWLHDKPMQAGEYHLPDHASMREIFLLLWEGRTVIRRVTIPEGLTVVEIRARLADAGGLKGDFPEGVKDGELLPETYRYSWGDTRAQIVERMREEMKKTLDELWSMRAPDLPIGKRKHALSLAAIVEKETSLPEERARVAAVYLNRLRKGMKLQADPTVIYAITGGQTTFGRTVTYADLKVDSPYNTYRYPGLPPGPIANPGRAAIQAALSPAHTDELYFVADGKGGHRFARTMEEHEKNVALYRKTQAVQEEAHP